MKRTMAWLCPRVLVCGSRVSGSLAAMFTTFFFCASAGTGPARTQTVRAATSTSNQRDR